MNHHTIKHKYDHSDWPLLDLAQLVLLNECTNPSLSIPSTLPHCPPPSSFGPVSHAPYCLFNLSPSFLPIPSISLPALHPGTEDDPSCFAQVCLYEATVYGMKGSNTITEQVSLHLCRSQLTFGLSFFSHNSDCIFCDIYLNNNAGCTALPADKEQQQRTKRKERTERHGAK